MIYLSIITFIVGLIFGSFFNVVSFRYLMKQSIIMPASRCPQCQTPLKILDLIPIFSYLILKGKCRYCGLTISPIYPLVELATGLIFVWALNRFGLSYYLAEFIILGSFLIILSIIDFKEFILPDILVLLTLISGIILKVGLSIYQNQPSVILYSLLGAVIGFLFFYLIYAIYPEGMGGGDVKLAFVLGWFVSFPQVVLWLFLSFFLGSLGGVLYLLLLKKKYKDPLPFGPFLALAALITLSWGQQLINLYLSFFWR